MVYVICSKYPACDGPGTAEYTDEYVAPNRPIEAHRCGFCESPMRPATEEEIAAYNVVHHPQTEEEN